MGQGPCPACRPGRLPARVSSRACAPGCGQSCSPRPAKPALPPSHWPSELGEYGAKILLIENGRMRGLEEDSPPDTGVDEFLSPLLDILPVQIAADWLVRTSGIEPGFRYISKVVRQL